MIFVCMYSTYVKQGMCYTASLEILFDRDTFIFSWNWLINSILSCLHMCIFCGPVSDTYFCIDE